jgi:hypothetical protein
MHPDDVSSPEMRRSYVRVVILEAIVIAGLWTLARLYS